MKKQAFVGFLVLATSFTAFGASRNYDSLKLNDDGTSTIIGPKFKVATGSNARLSGTSNTNGVCKLYGFDFMVGDSVIATGDSNSKTAVINDRGRYSTYRSYSSRYNNHYITSIVCARNHQALTISNRIRPSENDDGSFTLSNPTVGHYDTGKVSRVSGTSNLHGVCKYYGLGAAIPATAIKSGDSNAKTVVLNGNGGFSSFRSYSSRYNNHYLVSLVCEAADGYPQDNGELDETVEISKRELMRMQSLIGRLQDMTSVLRTDLAQTQAERESLKRQLEQAIADLEREVELNGEAKRKLEKLKRQLRALANGN